jgi:excisionase family DNA binding protein
MLNPGESQRLDLGRVIPGALLRAGERAGLTCFERHAALLVGLQQDRLVGRPSFFQLDRVRKARAAGVPIRLIAHEDVLIFRAPDVSRGFTATEGLSAGTPILARGIAAQAPSPPAPDWFQDLMAPTMHPPTSNNAPHQGEGSRYGPTPAAPDGGADRQAPAPETCKETDQWPATDRPGDHPPPTSPGAPVHPGRHLGGGPRRLPEVLTVREAAAILRVGRNQLYQAVGRGQLRAVRIGRSIRIPKQALLDLLTQHSPPAASDDE